MYMPINPLGYPCIKILQRDNLLHAYNEPINIYSAGCPTDVVPYIHSQQGGKRKCWDSNNGTPFIRDPTYFWVSELESPQPSFL